MGLKLSRENVWVVAGDWQEMPAAQLPPSRTAASFLFSGFRLESGRSWLRTPALERPTELSPTGDRALFPECIHAVPCSFTLFQLLQDSMYRPEFPAP